MVGALVPLGALERFLSTRRLAPFTFPSLRGSDDKILPYET